MFVKVLVMIPNSKTLHRELHEFTRVPSIGEKIDLSRPGVSRPGGVFVVTDVTHLSLQRLRGGDPQAEIFVKPV